jgi:putative phage-type endonuclease
MQAYQQNTPEWEQMRLNKIGASDAPVIMGVSPWKTPYQLWEEKLGLKKNAPKTMSMERGIKLENQARDQFERLTGLVMMPQVIQHPSYEWMMASLDGIDFLGHNIVEIKCPGREDHCIALDGRIPEKYYPQMQHQLAVTDLKEAYYFSYDGQNGVIVMVPRDDEYIEKLIDAEKKFWNSVESLEAPKLVARDYVEKSDEEWTQLSSSWLECNRQLEFYKEEEERIRERLIELSDKNNCRGGGIMLSRVVRKGNVDYKAVPELKTVNLDAYRKQSIEMWRLMPSK